MGIIKGQKEGRPTNLYKWNRMNLSIFDIPRWANFAGTYAIFSQKKCIYVGQSNNIFLRLNRHLRIASYSSGWFIKRKKDEYYLLDVEIAIKKEKIKYERLMIEKRLIVKLKPIFNLRLKLIKEPVNGMV